MAYTDVITVATGDTWTAANNNTYIRDNFAAGVPAIFTAAGDIAYASGVKAASRLGIGTEGQALVVGSSGLPEWGSAIPSISVEHVDQTSDELLAVTSGNYSDISGMTKTITVTQASKIILIATGTMSDQSESGIGILRSMIDGNAGKQSAVSMGAYKWGIAVNQVQAVSAGSIVCKLQASTTNSSNSIYVCDLSMTIIVIPTS